LLWLTHFKNICIFQGSVAYVSQQAWIRNATLQKNILFGKDMNKQEYEAAIDATALRTFLKCVSQSKNGWNVSGIFILIQANFQIQCKISYIFI
jgi:ABC-type transport system involved in cytochrome bd biosynthesis fused ATPase/permease subunit